MRKALIVIDMQNDFVTGTLGTYEAQAIVPKVKRKIEKCVTNKQYDIYFTKDTHFDDYDNTLEGKYLPIHHCRLNTYGHEIIPELKILEEVGTKVIKTTFGSYKWDSIFSYLHGWDRYGPIQFELIGLCTDICVISNALILRTLFPNCEIIVDAECCAGTTPEKHKAALEVMKSCQIKVINEE